MRSGNCDAANSKLRWLYETARRCSRDEDCNYVDGFYNVIPRDSRDSFVTTIECGVSTPFLIVANGARVAQASADLDQQASTQSRACAPNAAEASDYGTDCRAKGGFTSELPPVCNAGVCQARRGEGYYGP
jgi:hypothetical protein